MAIFRTEKELESQICEYIAAHKVNPINFREVVSFSKQMNLGSYGIADIVTIEKHGEKDVINVIELKNTPFQAGMIFQVGRYIEAVKLGANHKTLGEDALYDPFLDLDPPKIIFPNHEIIGTLVCSECDELSKGIESVFGQLGVTVYSVEFELLSIVFNQWNNTKSVDVGQTFRIQESLAAMSDLSAKQGV